MTLSSAPIPTGSLSWTISLRNTTRSPGRSSRGCVYQRSRTPRTHCSMCSTEIPASPVHSKMRAVYGTATIRPYITSQMPGPALWRLHCVRQQRYADIDVGHFRRDRWGSQLQWNFQLHPGSRNDVRIYPIFLRCDLRDVVQNIFLRCDLRADRRRETWSNNEYGDWPVLYIDSSGNLVASFLSGAPTHHDKSLQRQSMAFRLFHHSSWHRDALR